MLGKAYYEEEDYGESERYLALAVKDEPASLEVVKLLSEVYIELSDYKQAINLYNQATALDQNNAGLVYQLGLLHYTLNNEKEAVKYFELAAEKGYKTDLDFKENLGMAYLGFNVEKGIEVLNQVLEKKPGNPEILLQIAQAHFKSRNFQLAADTFYKVYQNDPTNSKALYMTGIAYNKKGDRNLGNSLCEKAIQLDPKLAELKRLSYSF
jgi:Flp pilus assembly protein TadD